MNKYLFEVCSTSIDDVKAAIACGADRVELCRDLDTGGLTPDYDTIRATVELARKAGRPFSVMVLIRSREGNFIYSEAEKTLMKRSVDEICDLGVDGVVIGALNPDLSIDTVWATQIVELAHAKNCSVTFHRAFDRVTDFDKALDEVIATGADRILTAGGCYGAERGIDTLAQLVRRADGRIIIMPGGGVRSANISHLRDTINATEYHSSCRIDAQQNASPLEVQKIASLLKS